MDENEITSVNQNREGIVRETDTDRGTWGHGYSMPEGMRLVRESIQAGEHKKGRYVDMLVLSQIAAFCTALPVKEGSWHSQEKEWITRTWRLNKCFYRKICSMAIKGLSLCSDVTEESGSIEIRLDHWFE